MSRSSREPGIGPRLRIEIHTIGHSVLGLEDFLSRLRAVGVRGLADVRRFPASRRHPHFNRANLERVLPPAGIEYRWFEDLGGRRARSESARESPNGGLRVAGFRAYADYALTPPFLEALTRLLEWASGTRVALCCAEALWWQCHRRIIADHVTARGHTVSHIMDEGELVPHELWELARLVPEGVIYPAEQAGLFTPAR